MLSIKMGHYYIYVNVHFQKLMKGLKNYVLIENLFYKLQLS